MEETTRGNFPILPFATYSEWLDWLAEHAETSKGIWVKFAKKSSGIVTLTYEEAREGALRYGWIDGLVNKFDEQYYLTRFTPRKPRSVWSKINIAIVEDLLARGLLFPGGLAEVERAKADGRWEAAYDSPSTISVPPDFQMALDVSPTAATVFKTLKSANRYSFLYRLQTTRLAETRAQRIEKFVQMLERGETF